MKKSRWNNPPNLLILHDLSEQDASEYLPQAGINTILFPAMPSVRNCIGCFACWVKTPGVCTIDDRVRQLVEIYPYQDVLIIVSRCVYGGLSPDVKAVIERNMGVALLPFFRVVDGEMHHPPRHKPLKELRVHFYGADISELNKKTANALVAANSLNFNAKQYTAAFHPTLPQVKEALL
jgi:multimeric flavodoxin WrbA